MDLSRFSLDGKKLKIIGWVFTVTGGVGAAFFPIGEGSIPGIVLELLGRISLPIFAFLLVEGFLCSGNLKRYVLSITITAIAAEPFFDYACTGKWLEFDAGQNPMLAFVLLLMELYLICAIGSATRGRAALNIIMVILSPFWGILFNIRYGGIVMLLGGVFFLLREKVLAQVIVATAVGAVPYGTPAIGSLVTALYNGERGKYPKYLFYGMYVAMWALLAVGKLLLK